MFSLVHFGKNSNYNVYSSKKITFCGDSDDVIVRSNGRYKGKVLFMHDDKHILTSLAEDLDSDNLYVPLKKLGSFDKNDNVSSGLVKEATSDTSANHNVEFQDNASLNVLGEFDSRKLNVLTDPRMSTSERVSSDISDIYGENMEVIDLSSLYAEEGSNNVNDGGVSMKKAQSLGTEGLVTGLNVNDKNSNIHEENMDIVSLSGICDEEQLINNTYTGHVSLNNPQKLGTKEVTPAIGLNVNECILMSSASSNTSDISDICEENMDIVSWIGICDEDQLTTTNKTDTAMTETEDKKREVSKTKFSPKKHACYYCGKLYSNIRKHWKHIHPHESLVKEALGNVEKIKGLANKGSLHRCYDRLRKLGNEKYNIANPDKVIVSRRSNRDNATYLFCRECSGRYSEKNFKKHIKYHKNQHQFVSRKTAKIDSLKTILGSASLEMKHYIFPYLMKTSQRNVIINDPIIVNWGNICCQAYLQKKNLRTQDTIRDDANSFNKLESDAYGHISSDLRLLADIVLHARQSDESIRYLDDLFHGSKQDVLFSAIDSRSGFDGSNYKHPTVATNACILIKKILAEVRCMAMKHGKDGMAKRYEDMKFLIESRQNKRITKRAAEDKTTYQRTRELVVLPTTEEVNELLCKLEDDLEEAFDKARENLNLQTYIQALKSAGAKIMSSNRKRPGDIHKMLVDEFRKHHGLTEDILNKYPPNERAYLSKLRRIVTRHKLNQMHSVLLSEKEINLITYLLENRSKLNVSSKFVFAHPKAKRNPFIRADLALREACCKHGLNTKVLSATLLRKHFATSTSSVPEQDVICNYMGHSENVHKNIYQIKEAQKEIVIMGRLLRSANGFDFESATPLTRRVTQRTRSQEVPLAPWLREGGTISETDSSLDNATISLDHSHASTTSENNGSANQLDQYLRREEVESTSGNVFLSDLSTILERSVTPEQNVSTNEKFSEDMIDSGNQTPKRKIKSFTREELFKSRTAWDTPLKHKIRSLFKEHLMKRQIPGFREIDDILSSRDGFTIKKSHSQIRAWIIAEIKRRDREKNEGPVNRWTTPEKTKLRDTFKKYYDLTLLKRYGHYPTTYELNQCIKEVPELAGRTVEQLRSKLQNEFYHKIRQLEEEELRSLESSSGGSDNSFRISDG